MSRFKSDGCTVQADARALNMGIAARQAGQKLSENPFGNPDSLDMLGKPVRLLALSWRAGWCDAGRLLTIANRLEKGPSPAISKKTTDIQE